MKYSKYQKDQRVDLPETAAVMHRSKVNRTMWPSISAKFESEVLEEAESWVSGVWSAEGWTVLV